MKNTHVALAVAAALLVGGLVGHAVPGRDGDFGRYRGGEAGRGFDGPRDGYGGGMMGGRTGGTMDAGVGMDDMMANMAAGLAGKTGDELDRAFLAEMIVHHQGAVDMAKALAAGSKRPEMQKFAADIVRVQSGEIDQMKAWQKSWFGN